MLGLDKGDTKLITKTFPEDFETKVLAGKTVMLRVTLNSIKEKKLPEINDELAQDISEKFQTLDDLKADIRQQAGRRGEVRPALPDGHPSSSTPSWRRARSRCRHPWWTTSWRPCGRTTRTSSASTRSDSSPFWKAGHGASRTCGRTGLPAAEKRARLQLVVSEIAKKEGIGIEDSDLDAEIAKMADERKVTAAELKESLAKNNLEDYMRSNLRMDKLYDFLLSKTKIRASEKRKVLDILQGN